MERKTENNERIEFWINNEQDLEKVFREVLKILEWEKGVKKYRILNESGYSLSKLKEEINGKNLNKSEKLLDKEYSINEAKNKNLEEKILFNKWDSYQKKLEKLIKFKVLGNRKKIEELLCSSLKRTFPPEKSKLWSVVNFLLENAA
jgi:hypothetical protein